MYCLTHLQLGKMAAIFMNEVLFFDSRFVPKGQIDNKHSIGSGDGFVSTRQQLPEPMLTYTFRREKKHTQEKVPNIEPPLNSSWYLFRKYRK